MSVALRRAAAADRLGQLELDPARLQGFAQQAFDLGIDAPDVRGGAAVYSRPQGGIDPTGVGLALAAPAWPLLVEGAGVDDRLGVALAPQDDHQVRHHRRAPLVVEVHDLLL